MRGAGVVGVVLVALCVPGDALAVPPAITSVSAPARHVTATVSVPRADAVIIYVATMPDRATDGSFLQENIETSDSLADSEIQAGRGSMKIRPIPGRIG
jgi:hypothetical protein